MHFLCSFCIVYIFFIFSGGSLLSVCVLALLAWWQGVFSLHEGRCFEEGVEMLANDVSPSFSTFVWLPLSFWPSPPPFCFLTLTLFLFDLPIPVFLQYRCQRWRPRLTSLKTEELKDEGEEGYLSGWSSKKAVLPTWKDCFLRSTAGTQTHTDNNVHPPHIHIRKHVELLLWGSCSGRYEKLCVLPLHYAWQHIFFAKNHFPLLNRGISQPYSDIILCLYTKKMWLLSKA